MCFAMTDFRTLYPYVFYMNSLEPKSRTPFLFPKSDEIYKVQQTYLSKILLEEATPSEVLPEMARALDITYQELGLPSDGNESGTHNKLGKNYNFIVIGLVIALCAVLILLVAVLGTIFSISLTIVVVIKRRKNVPPTSGETELAAYKGIDEEKVLSEYQAIEGKREESDEVQMPERSHYGTISQESSAESSFKGAYSDERDAWDINPKELEIGIQIGRGGLHELFVLE